MNLIFARLFAKRKKASSNDYVVVQGGLCVTPVLQVQLEHKMAGAELAEISS